MKEAVLEALELPSFTQGPHVFLSGPMGAGKSSVGAALAARLRRPLIDLDREIEAHAGATVSEIFRSRGEPAFRVLEAEVARRVALREEAAVVALGGGTVVDPETRRVLLMQGMMVCLEASARVLAERLRGTDDRPLMAGGEPEAVLEELLQARQSAYAEAHLRLRTDGTDRPDPATLAERIEQAAAEEPVLVPLGRRSYCATFGPRGAVVSMLSAHSKVLVVSDTHTAGYGESLCLAMQGRAQHLVLEPGEQHKHVGSLERIWDAASNAEVGRDGALVAVGGGVVGDLTGLAAATWLRGVAFGVVPTTLLSMADSAIGGKTAIDRGAQKNLVGAFHQPSWVRIDTETLASLPDRERRSGLGEVVKCAWLAGEDALAQLELSAEALSRGDHEATQRAVAMAVRVKARVVAADETEQGARRALNLGHTLGHAFESASAFALLHGEAVGLGLLAALRCAAAMGGTHGAVLRIEALLGRLGLPTDVEAWLSRQGLLPHVRADKKRVGQQIRFVLPTRPGEVQIARLDPEGLLAAAREFGTRGPQRVG